MKKIFTSIAAMIIFTASVFQAIGQTNVSGNISANTTWSISGSPYIITDSVVLMPGYKLTIQPGVTVKFNHLCGLQINQSTIIALGNATDSIIFTADTSAPYQGFWGSIYLNQNDSSVFNYCSFKYGSIALNASPVDTVIIKNSVFDSNLIALNASQCNVDSCIISNNYQYGIEDLYFSSVKNSVIANNDKGIDIAGYSTLSNCLIACNNTGFNGGTAGGISVINTVIQNNVTGLIGSGNYSVKNCIIDSNANIGISLNGITDTLENCKIAHNGFGFEYTGSHCFITLNEITNNAMGIKYGGTSDSIFCNAICNNSTYNLNYTLSNNTQSFHNNYWCTTDTAAIDSAIYDHVQDTSLGLVFVAPVESATCSNIGPSAFSVPQFTSSCSSLMSVPAIQNKKDIVTIFPNPFHDFTTINIQGAEAYNNTSLHIYNLFGQEVRTIIVGSNTQLTITRNQLNSGMYFYKLINGNSEVLGMGKMEIE
jgi:hypothetical protein